MSHLVLELRAGETMMVNGATIRFRNKCRLELVSRARFLFGRQLMEESEAVSPLERLYYRLQTTYVGASDAGGDVVPPDAQSFAEVGRDLDPEDAAQLALVDRAYADGDHYRALKRLRALIERGRALPVSLR